MLLIIIRWVIAISLLLAAALYPHWAWLLMILAAACVLVPMFIRWRRNKKYIWTPDDAA